MGKGIEVVQLIRRPEPTMSIDPTVSGEKLQPA